MTISVQRWFNTGICVVSYVLLVAIGRSILDMVLHIWQALNKLATAVVASQMTIEIPFASLV